MPARAPSEIGDLYEMTYNLPVQPSLQTSGVSARISIRSVKSRTRTGSPTVYRQGAYHRRDRPWSNIGAPGSLTVDHRQGKDRGCAPRSHGERRQR
jgi:hypothetical protein